MNREEQAVQKFEKTMTAKQQDIIKQRILKDAFSEARCIMNDKYEACLYPSINFESSPSGIAQLMFNYGYKSQQLWARDKEQDKWVMYKYN